MICSDIEKRLKPFLDDLLDEPEYQDFIEHVKVCSKCKEYVDSVGSFTNQLSRLGDVRVPSDLSSTILFQLKNPVRKSQKSEPLFPKNFFVGILVLILVLMTLFFGTSYFKQRQLELPQQKEEIVPAPVVTVEVERLAVSKQDAEFWHERLQEIANSLGILEQGVVQEESIPGEEGASVSADSGQAVSVTGETAVVRRPVWEDELMVSKPKPFHWHFLYSGKFAEVGSSRFQERKGSVETQLRQGLRNMEELKAEIERLENEKDKIESGLLSFENLEKEVLAEEKSEIELQLRQKRQQYKQQQGLMELLGEESRSIESKILQGRIEKQGKEVNLTQMLQAREIGFEYQDNNIFVFSATVEELSNLLEQIALIPDIGFSLLNFTPAISDVTDRKHQVSIYIEAGATSVLHWHVSLNSTDQKLRLVDIIHDIGGVVNYDFEEVIVVSVPNAEVKNLRTRITALGAGFSEFDRGPIKEDQLISRPEEISIYFSTK